MNAWTIFLIVVVVLVLVAAAVVLLACVWQLPLCARAALFA